MLQPGEHTGSVENGLRRIQGVPRPVQERYPGTGHGLLEDGNRLDEHVLPMLLARKAAASSGEERRDMGRVSSHLQGSMPADKTC